MSSYLYPQVKYMLFHMFIYIHDNMFWTFHFTQGKKNLTFDGVATEIYVWLFLVRSLKKILIKNSIRSLIILAHSHMYTEKQ